MKKPAFILLFLIQAGFLFAQLGGQKSFEFLNSPVGARVAALGGVIISSTDDDVNLFMSNPALLDTANHNHISLSYMNFYGDVNYSSAAFARKVKGMGIFGFGIQNVGYGKFDSFDPSGNAMGSFNANETAVVVSHSHQLNVFKFGGSLKYLFSSIDNYSSSALSFDIGGSFVHPTREFTASLLFKNIGFLFTDYTPSSDSSLPTDLQVGFTFKPQHMPFRLSMTGYNLIDSNTTYYDQNFEDNEGAPNVGDKIFRHINIGTEIIFSKNINVRVGYNHLIRKELGLKEKAGMAGISLGFMARIKAFELSYTYTTYHIDSGRSYFTVTSNLNKVFKKKSII